VIRLQREVQERGIITKRFARAHPINLQYATVQYIKDWVWTVSDLFKNDEKEKEEIDIRSYFIKEKKD